MRIIELYIDTSGSTATGKVKLYGDEPLSLILSIEDIKTPNKKESPSSQTFTIPADKNNNILFNDIFQIGVDSQFNPAKKAPAYILVDGQLVFSGNLQLTKIKVKDLNVISYEVIIYSDVIDLTTTLGDSLLTDLDFSELNHNRDTPTIMNSWTADTKSLGYYYPFVDYYDLDIAEVNSGTILTAAAQGQVSTASATSITDTSAAWITNAYVGYILTIVGGAGVGQQGTITSNNGNSVSVNIVFNPIPNSTSLYSIAKLDTSNPYLSNGNGMNPNIFKPALSSTYVFKKILNNAGFFSEYGFIDSDIFAETILLFNGDDTKTQEQDIKTFNAFQTASTFSDIYSYPGSSELIDAVPFQFSDDYIRGYDVTDAYNNNTYIYTAPFSGINSEFFISLNYKYNQTTYTAYSAVTGQNPLLVWFDQFTVRWFRSSKPTGYNADPLISFSGTPFLYATTTYTICKVPGFETSASGPPNGTTMPDKTVLLRSPKLDGTVPSNGGVETSNGGVYNLFTAAGYTNPLLSGETVWFEVQSINNPNLYQVYTDNSHYYNKIYTDGVINNYIDYNKYVPAKIKQIDLIKSFMTKYNMLAIPNKNNPKRIKFVPRVDYFASGETKDWTDKLDESQLVEETILSEQQNKRIILSDKADKDYYNTRYTDETKTIYGEYIQTIDNEWLAANSEQKIETIFSPTPMTKITNSTDIIVPKIVKLDDNNNYGRTDFNLRLLRKNKNPMLTVNSIKLLGGPTINYYSYAGNEDHPFESNISYLFGTPEFSYYNTPGFDNLQAITPNNMVELYWKDYLDALNDKNSKIIKCKMKLTSVDIAQFKFNDIIYVKGLTNDGGHYFTVNKITYIPTSDDTSVVELVRLSALPRQKTISSAKLIAPPPSTGNIAYGSAAAGVRNTLIIGDGSTIDSYSQGSQIMGTNNTIGKFSSNSIINGNNNIIGNYVQNSVVYGENNIIGSLDALPITASTQPIISGVTLLGVSNYTATTSDTVYVPNLQFTNSASTINGVSISTIVAGSNVFTSAGTFSIKALNNTIIDAPGNYCLAIGQDTLASGTNAFAGGYLSSTYGGNTFAFGSGSTAVGLNSIALGSNSLAGGNYSFAVNGTASNDYSLSLGNETLANGNTSSAFGYLTIASGDYAHAEGNQTIASGNTSHAEGSGTTANGGYSHAEGFGTIANGFYSHAEGFQTQTTFNYSHAQNYQTIAQGVASHAEGFQTLAASDRTNANGSNSVANRYGEWARGTNANSQFGFLSYYGTTSNATPIEIFLNGVGAERFVIGFDETYKVKITGVIRNNFDVKEVEASGLIKNVSGSISLVGAFATTSTNADVAMATSTITVSADAVFTSLKITITGLAVGTTSFSLKVEYVALR
jgi:hypothetical protein